MTFVTDRRVSVAAGDGFAEIWKFSPGVNRRIRVRTRFWRSGIRPPDSLSQSSVLVM